MSGGAASMPETWRFPPQAVPFYQASRINMVHRYRFARGALALPSSSPSRPLDPDHPESIGPHPIWTKSVRARHS
jgi:hypothetical protein